MNWIGAVSGAILGSARGGGIVGGLIGSVVGNWAEEKVREYLGKKNSAGDPSDRAACGPVPETAHSPYDVLGVPPDATDEELTRAYREKVKHLHPDTLRGKELPDEVIETVNEKMARVNEAWAAIKSERNMR